MRHSISIIAALMATLMAPVAFGQAEDSDLATARAELQAGRDQILREDLQLSESELAAFWPIYEKYVAELAVLRDRKAELVMNFMRAYDSGQFTDEFANFLIKENFAIKREWAGIQEAYVERFSAVLSPQKVARFYQLENKMDAEVDAQLALAVPLVE